MSLLMRWFYVDTINTVSIYVVLGDVISVRISELVVGFVLFIKYSLPNTTPMHYLTFISIKCVHSH